ncbi:MAG: helix-turn-helix domain-containing protein, partial [Solirubrobacteraceae bacterium]
LAIEGMSNRQIAQALFITRKTVESHLEHVFRKLDIHSRAELKQAMTGAERSRADAEVPA